MANSTSTMESVRAPAAGPLRFERIYVWELPVRLFHWVNAICVTVLFATGLYIAHPILSSHGEAYQHFVMGRVRQVHFATALIFAVSFFWRSFWTLVGNEYARSGIPYFWRPRWWGSLVRQAFLYLRLECGVPHLGHNPLAGFSYAIFAVGLGFAQILTGFALYSQSSPGGFWDGLVGWLIPLLGGAFNTTMWHHLFAWGFVFFAILHVYIITLDGREFRNGLIASMIHGHKFRRVSREPRGED